jgi:uncharacterized membrane protein YqhA
MSEVHQSKARTQLAIVILGVTTLCAYTLFMKAHEVDNWRGFWFSLAHVVIIALGAWLSLRKIG